MDLLKHLKTLAEQVEVVDLQNEATSVEFEANKLKTSTVTETRGTAVRVVRDGKLGFAASSNQDAVERLAVNALESASYGDKVPIQFPGQQPGAPVRTYDPAIPQLPISRLVEMGREILDLALAVEPDLRCNISLSRSVQKVRIANSAGLDASYQVSPLSLGMEIDRIDGDDVLILYDSFGTTVWDDNYLAFARSLVEKLKIARKIVPIQAGNMPVLFSPVGALALGIPLFEGLNGKNVYKGTSPMIGKIGEKLFDEKITIVDNGTLDGKPASAPYDDEGVPHRCNMLVEKGVVKGFLYDLKTAAQSGAETTGNASRGLFNPPSPSATNFLINPGRTPLKDMIAGIDHGIIVENLLGLGQGNVLSGAFSNPLSLAFLVEKGEIVGRVKDVSIAGNVYELLKNVAAVSQEAEWVYGSIRAPYILLENMNVVGKK
jgi:PmbA protein